MIKHKSAFSLLEAVIYLAVVGGVLTAIIGVAINLSNVKAKATALNEVNYNLAFAADQLNAEISQAGDINFTGSILNVDNGRLELLGSVTGSVPTVVYLDSAAGRLKIISAAGIDNLTTQKVEVTKFRLSQLSTSTVAVDLGLKMRVSAESGPYYQGSGEISQVYRTRQDCRQGICL
ncbi:MAG: hypothetical protein WCO55_02310 [Candidatus Falkowbacteria bacterium]